MNTRVTWGTVRRVWQGVLGQLARPNRGQTRVPMDRIVVPSARDRWRGPKASQYTPERVETVLSGAFAGDLRHVWELFDLMEDTWPRLMKALNEVKRAVIGLDWTVQPWAEGGAKPGAEAVKRAALVEGLIWSMKPRPGADENDFQATIYDVMDAWGKGVSVVEIDWEIREGREVAPRCTRWINPRFYGWPADEADLQLNTLEILQSQATGRDRTPSVLGTGRPFSPFPDNKFVIAVAKHKTGHASAGALLRPLGWWWCAANFGAEWLLNYSQLFGQPIRWATYDPARKGMLGQLSAMLENLGSTGWAAFPAGTTLELKEAAKGGTQIPQDRLIEIADRTVDLLILGQTLTSDVGDSGSLALGGVHEGVRGDVIQSAAEWAASALAQLVRAITVLNFGNDKECPWLSPARNEVKDAKGMAERDAILLGQGVPLPRQWFYERHDVPPPAEGEEVITVRPPPDPFGGAAFGPPSPRTGNGPARDPADRDNGAIQAKGAAVPQDLMRVAVADLAGARTAWLAPLSDEFDRLARLARTGTVSDADLTRFVERARERLPELFGDTDLDALAESIESALGAAAVRGAEDALSR